HAPCRLILDADALNALEGAPEWLTRAAMTPIITPHVGEMSRLTGRSVQEIKQHAPKLARDFAREYRCVVVLKDASTVIASPEGRMFYHPGGNAGLARGGSGDLLAGMVASFAAQGMEAATAAAAAVTLHGASAARCAGRRSMTGMLPHDLLEDLCTVFVENGR
ncbi:MAG: ADP/ATP-dependent (S)-NAD(P)H-hydrate dehydratase, partial [Oscillospiraceae bacterium]